MVSNFILERAVCFKWANWRSFKEPCRTLKVEDLVSGECHLVHSTWVKSKWEFTNLTCCWDCPLPSSTQVLIVTHMLWGKQSPPGFCGELLVVWHGPVVAEAARAQADGSLCLSQTQIHADRHAALVSKAVYSTESKPIGIEWSIQNHVKNYKGQNYPLPLPNLPLPGF